MTYDRKGLIMNFNVPVISTHLKLVEADPFVLMHLGLWNKLEIVSA